MKYFIKKLILPDTNKQAFMVIRVREDGEIFPFSIEHEYQGAKRTLRSLNDDNYPDEVTFASDLNYYLDSPGFYENSLMLLGIKK